MTTEADDQQLYELLDNLFTSLSPGISNSGLTWTRVVNLYRVLSRILAQCLQDDGSSEALWDMFSNVWKKVLRHVVGWIADNGGWVSPLLFSISINKWRSLIHMY